MRKRCFATAIGEFEVLVGDGERDLLLRFGESVLVEGEGERALLSRMGELEGDSVVR